MVWGGGGGDVFDQLLSSSLFVQISVSITFCGVSWSNTLVFLKQGGGAAGQEGGRPQDVRKAAWTLLETPAHAFIPETHNASADHTALASRSGETPSAIAHQLKTEVRIRVKFKIKASIFTEATHLVQYLFSPGYE